MLPKIQPDIDNVQLWCMANRLKINESKSKVLLFASRQKLVKIDLTRNIRLGNVPLSYCGTP